MQFRIPENNLPALTKKIESLIRRAAKLGCNAITFSVGEGYEVPLVIDPELRPAPKFEGESNAELIVGYRRYFPVTVEGEAPSLNGWALAAVLQAVELEDGSRTGILRTVGEQAIPVEMRERHGDCDHCGHARYRNDVFVVRNETGEHKVVGSTCLADFLGHDDPEAAARIAQYLAEIGETCEGAEDEDFFGFGGREASIWGVDRVLNVAACAIRLNGWTSRAKSKEMEIGATADTVAHILTNNPACSDYREINERYVIEAADETLAEAAREWARGLENSNNEYLYTLSVIARLATCDARNLGVAVSMIAAYQREIGAQAERTAQFGESKHFGTIGERIRLTVELVSLRQIEGEYGLKTIMNYRTADGSKATWFASGDGCTEMEIGGTYDVMATIKRHDEYRGIPQTTLTRVALYVEKVKKPRKPRKARTAAEVSA